MPFGDGTGPLGQGPGTGRGLGRCRGGRRRIFPARGGSGIRFGAGPGGNCICPSCGRRVLHTPGVPCSTIQCPDCGARMVRE